MDPGPLLQNLAAFVAFAQKRVRDPELAADVVQTALARALARQHQLQDEPRLLAWFWRILRNTVAEVHRRRATEARVLGELPEGVDDLPDEAVQTVCACLATAVATLPQQQADVLRAVDLDAGDPAAVAARLGITTNNLNVRRHRARQALLAALQATCRLCAAHGCLDCDCSAQPPP
jgi:RNA polymerase sigma-70 factor (ECF subfamily)